jgi:hypothetical protein
MKAPPSEIPIQTLVSEIPIKSVTSTIKSNIRLHLAQSIVLVIVTSLTTINGLQKTTPHTLRARVSLLKQLIVPIVTFQWEKSTINHRLRLPKALSSSTLSVRIKLPTLWWPLLQKTLSTISSITTALHQRWMGQVHRIGRVSPEKSSKLDTYTNDSDYRALEGIPSNLSLVRPLND